MSSNRNGFLALSIAAVLLSACGGSGDSGTPTPTPQAASMPMLISDASTEDWATIGVKVLSIALVPQGGGSNVTVYTALSPAPTINLVQLDQLAEILGNVSVPVGTYTGAVITVSGNASDVVLTTAADPESGFAAASGVTIATGQIQVQHTQGAAGSLIVPIDVTLATPLVVSTTQSNALDLEFDLAHPAFIVAHVPPGASGDSNTVWAVDFNAPVHHHPLHDLPRLVLRHTYGDVTAVSTDAASITISKEFPTEPAVNPETAVQSTQSLQIMADATNGTLFYDLDAKTSAVVKDFSAQAMTLPGKSVRIAARYQANGTLIATRIWASSTFGTVYASPEGHVLHVNTASNIVTVASESGTGIPLRIDANTQFFFRQPQDGLADATPIATGTTFLASHGLTRGFKVHASVVDPLATPLVAQTIDIESAVYDGSISASTSTGFTYTRNFRASSDDYVAALAYIAPTTPNGDDPSGTSIVGYKWWNFAYPTVLMSGSDAVSGFVAATDGSVNFGGTIGSVPSHGASSAVWNDPANPNGWAISATVLTPTTLPLGFVASGLVNDAFLMTVVGGTTAATVEIGTSSGSATLIYQIDRTNNIVTVTSIDATTSSGLTELTAGLATGAPVRVYGIPQADGTLKAYVLAYFTGDMPTQ